MTTEAERIAAGLTEAQRRALMKVDRHYREQAFDGRTLNSLYTRGLAYGRESDHDFRDAYVHYTPLGLEVRAHLTSKDQPHG